MSQLGFDFVPPRSEQEAYLRAARGLPGGEPALLHEARATLQAINRAMLAGADISALAERYQAIAVKLYGDCDAERYEYEDEAPPEPGGGDKLERATAAPDGRAPMWGQRGCFVLQARDYRAVIEIPGLLSAGPTGFVAYPLDYDRPWLVATGILELTSHISNAQGRSVKQYVRRRLAEFRLRYVGHRRRIAPLVELREHPWDAPNLGDKLRPPDEPAWREGGWIFEYLKANPWPKEEG